MLSSVDSQPSSNPGPTSTPARVIWLAVALGMTVFFVGLWLEKRWDRLEVLQQFDVLFDMDPNLRLAGISRGVEAFRLVHPNFGNYFRIPIQVVVRGGSAAGLWRGQESEIARQLALLVTPGVAGLSVAVMLLVLSRLGLSLWQSLLVASLGAVSFSQLIGASVPEHFPLGGLCLGLGFLQAAREINRGGIPHWPVWCLVGVLAAGTTITQAIPILILCFATALSNGLTRLEGLKRVILVGVAIGLLTYGSAFLLNRVFGEQLQSPQGPADATRQAEPRERSGYRGLLEHHWTWVQRFLRQDADAGTLLVRIPEVLTNTLAPRHVREQPLDSGTQRQAMYDFGFTLEGTGSAGAMAGLSVLLVSGILGSRRGTKALRVTTLGAIGILVFNIALHTLWGREFFLYSQHWLVPLLVLLAGNLAFPPPWSRIITMLLAGGVVLVAASNMATIRAMLERLQAV